MNDKRDKYSLTVRGSDMHLFTQNTITTAVFKSSCCRTNIFVFDNEQDLIKAKEYYKQKKGA